MIKKKGNKTFTRLMSLGTSGVKINLSIIQIVTLLTKWDKIATSAYVDKNFMPKVRDEVLDLDNFFNKLRLEIELSTDLDKIFKSKEEEEEEENEYDDIKSLINKELAEY